MRDKEKQKEYHKQYYIKNRERVSEYHNKYYQEHKAQWRKRYKQKYRNPSKRRDSTLRNKFGITLEDYNSLLGKQDECCLLCNRHYSELVKGLAVDHDHKTGRVRGLLCGPCNTRLGWFETHKNKIMEYLNA